MIQVAKSILLVVSALFPIVDPIGGSPVFLLLTRDYAAETRRALARRIAVDSFIPLVASFTLAAHVLSFFGIALPVVQVGGWADRDFDGLGDADSENGRTVTCADAVSQAFYPLTLPLNVGPGSISVAITLGANAPAPGRKPAGNSRGGDRFRFRSSNHLSLLRLRRSAREQAGSHRDQCNSKAHRVLAGVHWSADLVERREQLLSSLPQFGGVVALPR